MSARAEIDRPPVLTETGQRTLRGLMRAWFEFERRLAQVPVIRRLDAGTFTTDDYIRLLLHLRQQVIEGARWISLAASSFDREHADVRSAVIGHARDEHRDYEMLEADFVSAGGDIDAIRRQPRNLGTEALHAYLMYRAGRPNPVCLLGAMWVIEGLGQKMANHWAERVENLTARKGHTTFMRYHADNDDTHLDKLYGLLDRLCTSDEAGESMVRTAQVVARLYAMQLEEVDA